MTFPRLLAVLAPLAVLVPAAQAGPLPAWSFRTVIATAPGQTELYLGPYRLDGATAHAYATLPGGNSGSHAGDATITLASVGKGAYRLDPTAPADGAVLLDSFRMLLEITDGRSGIRGHVAIGGRGTFPGYEPGGGGEVELDGRGSGSMLIAGTRYDYTWRDTGSESVSRIEAIVSVTTANTPEPATLALAGLGLGAVGLRRFFRGASL